MLQTAWLLPPTRLLTLGSDPARFQTEPPACYRASWQLPGRDSHPLATTSLCWITIYISTSNPGHTTVIELAPAQHRLLSSPGNPGVCRPVQAQCRRSSVGEAGPRAGPRV